MLRYLPAGIEVIGFAFLSAAAYLVALPLGLAVTGIALAATGYAVERLTRKGKK